MLISFYLLIYLSFSALVGVDIGSEHLRASILRPGKQMEILLDSNSRRTFSTIMTIIPTNGEAIPNIINSTEVNDYDYVMNDPLSMRKYPNSTIRHWSNFVAKLGTAQLRDLSKKRHFYAPITTHYNDRALLCGIFPELIFHRSLPQINISALNLDPNAVIKSSVFSVPKFWPQQERDSIRSMARALKFGPLIVDSTRAVGTYFAMEHQKHFSKKPLNVAFFDFGASNVQIVITEFVKQPKLRITELSYVFDDQVGGRDIDIIIFDLLMSKYKGPSLSPRNEQIFLTEANKIKHRLTIDKEANGQIEEVDFVYSISRKEFEEALKPILDKVRSLISESLQNARADRVQMLGGISRIPIVQEVVKEAFGVERLMFSMNAEESFAIGAAYVGAASSSDFMLPALTYIPLKLYNQSIRTNTSEYEYNGTIPEVGKVHWIYNQVLDDKGHMDRSIPYPVGSSIYLAWSSTNSSTKIKLTKDGLFRFKNGTMRNTKYWKKHILNLEKAIEEKEEEKRKLGDAVNKLESLLLDTKMTLTEGENGNFNKMTTENEKKALSAAVTATDRWFLKQREFEIKSITQRLKMFQDAVGSVMCRVQNAEMLPVAEENMTNLISSVNDTIKNNWLYKSKSKRPKRKEIRSLIRKVVELKMWHDERSEVQSTLSDTDNPALLWNEIIDRTEDIDKFLERLKDKAMGRTKKEDEKDVYVYPPKSTTLQIED